MKSAYLRKLGAPHTAKILAPMVIGLICSPSLTAGTPNIKNLVQVHINVVQYLQRILIRITFPCYSSKLLSSTNSGIVLGGGQDTFEMEKQFVPKIEKALPKNWSDMEMSFLRSMYLN